MANRVLHHHTAAPTSRSQEAFLEGATLLRLADIHRWRPRGDLLAAQLLETS